MQQFLLAWERTGNLEKGYANVEGDRGGETNFGITIAVARAYGYDGPMKDLSRDTACSIGKSAYWDVNLLDDVAQFSTMLASKLFDIGFLNGAEVAGRFLQRALNAFNRSDLPEPAYPQLKVDGRLGKMTVSNLGRYWVTKDAAREKVILRAVNCQEGTRFLDIVESDPGQEKFDYGWFANRID
jgi:lysozyme family protein